MSPRPAVSGRTAGILALLLTALTLGLAGCGTPEPTSTVSAAPPPTASPTSARAPAPPVASGPTIEDGFIPDGASVSPFDTAHPAIANLSPALLAAIQQAANDAAADGVDLAITSGWRSASYQQALLSEAIALHGSVDEARRWVNTPERSTHVTGDAVDTGPWDANAWLARHGYRYGLCQTYANEPWHFELMVAPGEQCPEPVTDASVG